MTPRTAKEAAWQLQEENVRLHSRIRELQARIRTLNALPARTAWFRCVYCGGYTTTLTCAAHSDLPALDPRFSTPPLSTPLRAARRKPKVAA